MHRGVAWCAAQSHSYGKQVTATAGPEVDSVPGCAGRAVHPDFDTGFGSHLAAAAGGGGCSALLAAPAATPAGRGRGHFRGLPQQRRVSHGRQGVSQALCGGRAASGRAGGKWAGGKWAGGGGGGADRDNARRMEVWE